MTRVISGSRSAWWRVGERDGGDAPPGVARGWADVGEIAQRTGARQLGSTILGRMGRTGRTDPP